MSKSKLGFLVAAIATSSILGVSAVSAEPQSGTQVVQNMNRDALIANPATLQNTNAQVTSVSQFSDVQPTEWAFTALQSLVERYGCIAGFPNGTFRGNRATSRYEFAAGLNACLDKINELISSGLADKVGKEDLATLQKLQEEFAAELAALKGRVTALEAKTATLEAQQFSTTTKLTGSAIFALGSGFGNSTALNTFPVGTNPNGNPPQNNGNTKNVTLGGRARLNFNTSFSGRDLLFIRLQAGNITGTNTAGGGAANNPFTSANLSRTAFDENTGNTFELDRLFYRFPVSKEVNVVVGTRVNIEDVLDVVNPDLVSAESGSISRFARRDPLVFRGQEGAGAGVRFKLNDQFAFNLAYLADSTNPTSAAANPGPNGGLFGGGYSVNAQILFIPIKPLTLSFVYQRGFDPATTARGDGAGLALAGGTGTAAANSPLFGLGSTAAESDRYGFFANFDLNPKISLNGRFSYANTRSVGNGATADILSWLTSVTFKDLFLQGSQATLAFGQQPFVTSGTVQPTSGFQSPYHLEAFYRFQLSKNISVTPGLITILNPLSSSTATNDPVFVGVLRTSFTF
jgi:hypothetical protein